MKEYRINPSSLTATCVYSFGEFLFHPSVCKQIGIVLMLSVFFANPADVDAWNAELSSQVLLKERTMVHE